MYAEIKSKARVNLHKIGASEFFMNMNFSLCFSILILFLLVGCEDKEDNRIHQRSIPVTILRLEKNRLRRKDRLTGSVVPWKQQVLNFQISGKVQKLKIANLGKRIKGVVKDELGNIIYKGDLIATLDNTPYRSALEEARALVQIARIKLRASRQAKQVLEETIKAAKSRVDSAREEMRKILPLDVKIARVQYKKAVTNFEMIRDAYGRKGSKVARVEDARSVKMEAEARLQKALLQSGIKKKKLQSHIADLVKAEVEKKLRQAEEEIAETQLRRAMSAVKKAKQNLKKCELRAPFDGVVSKIFVNPGSSVNEMTPIASLVMIDPVRVDISVSLKKIRDFHFGDEVAVYPFRGNHSRKGSVYRIHTSADPSTRTFLAIIAVRNELMHMDPLPDNSQNEYLFIKDFSGIVYKNPANIGSCYVDVRCVQREPLLLRFEDLADPSWLFEKFYNPENKVAKYLKGRFSANLLSLMERYSEGKVPARIVQQMILYELNKIIQGKLIYDPRIFAGITLSQETRVFLSQNYDRMGRMYINRLLLEESFPDLIRNSSFLRIKDILNPDGIMSKLKSKSNQAMKYVYESLSTETKKFLREKKRPDHIFMKSLINDLNQMIANKNFYSKHRFAGVQFTKELRQRLSRIPQEKDLMHLNRQLLEWLCPDYILEKARISSPGDLDVSLSLADFKDLRKFISALKDPDNVLAKRLRSMLSAGTLMGLNRKNISPQMISGLIHDLNQGLQAKLLYDWKTFRDFDLPSSLLQKIPQKRDYIKTNRFLLESVYPEEIKLHTRKFVWKILKNPKNSWGKIKKVYIQLGDEYLHVITWLFRELKSSSGFQVDDRLLIHPPVDLTPEKKIFQLRQDWKFHPGELVEVEYDRELPSAIYLPTEAIISRDGYFYVFVVESIKREKEGGEFGIAKIRKIIKKKRENLWMIQGRTLSEKQHVVIHGVYSLYNRYEATNAPIPVRIVKRHKSLQSLTKGYSFVK